MNKISPITQELVNSFPEWARLRMQKQSMGYQLLNAFAIPLEEVAFDLNKVKHNVFLSTVNLHEPDLIYKVNVNTYTFQENTQNGAFLGYVAPVVEGHLDNSGTNKITLTNIEDGSLKSFWQDSDPDRISSSSSFQGTPVALTDINVDDFILGSVSYPITHHLKEGGKFYFDLTTTSPYIEVKDQKLKRARIRIEGELAKGVEGSETLIFPWKNTISSRKVWKKITKIEVYDVDSAATLSVLSELVDHSEYMSLSNLRYSTLRNRIDEFWGIINKTSPNASYLERVEYVSDRVPILMTQSADKLTKDRWALKDTSGATIQEIKDMALIPFKDKFWATDGSKLYLFPLAIENYENLDKLLEKDKNSEITIKFVTEDVITGEELRFSVWHERQLSKIEKFQIWYVDPGGYFHYLTNNGESGFEEYSGTTRILLDHRLTVDLEGEYVIRAQIETSEGIQTTCNIYKNNVKVALKEFDLTGVIPSTHTVEGIYYDADQLLLLKTTYNSDTFYYQIDEHKDIMLIDYTNKVIYLHEKYKGIDLT